MVIYWKSDEGLKAYAKIEQPYPVTEWDKDYDRFIAETKSSDERGRTKRTITRLTRVHGADGKDYIVYSERELRFDDLGNSKKRFRDNLGQYPQPEGHYSIYYDTNNQQKTKIDSITNINTGYFIPFSPKKMDELYKYTVNDVPQRAGRTEYFVQRINDSLISVESFEDLRDGEFDELAKYGKRTAAWKEEKDKLKKEQEQLEVAREVAENTNKPEDEDVKIRAQNLQQEIVSGAIEEDTASNIKEGGAADSMEALRQRELEEEKTSAEIAAKERKTRAETREAKANKESSKK